MKKLLIVLALAASMPAFADITAADAQAQANAAAIAAAQANGNKNNVIFTSPANTTSVTSSDQHVSGTQTLKTVPMVYAPPIGVTAPCMVALSGGLSVVGFGISAGGSIEDKGCTLRETSRLLHGIGQEGAAARVMCNNELAAKAMGPAICPVEAQPKPAPVSYNQPAPAPVAYNNPLPSTVPVTQIVADNQKDSIVCARTGTRC